MLRTSSRSFSNRVVSFHRRAVAWWSRGYGRFQAIAFLLMALLSVVAFAGDAQSKETSGEGRLFMSVKHIVIGKEIQSYSHSDPKPPQSLRGFLVPRITTSWVRKIVWSPDGARLASLASFSDELILWDVNAGSTIKKIALGSYLNRADLPLAFSADGNNLVVFNNSNAPPGVSSECMLLIDGHTGTIVRPLTCPQIDGKSANLALISPFSGKNEFAMLINSGFGQSLSIFDAATQQMTDTIFTLNNLRVYFYEHDMAISPDGNSIAIIGHIRRPARDKNDNPLPFNTEISGLVILDLLRNTQSYPVLINEDSTNSWASIIRYSPDGSKIAIGMANEDPRPIRLFDVREAKITQAYASPVNKTGGPKWGTIHGLDWSPDKRLIALCGEDHTVYMLDAQSGAIIDSISTYGDCGAVAFNPEGTLLAYGTGNTVIVRTTLPRN